MFFLRLGTFPLVPPGPPPWIISKWSATHLRSLAFTSRLPAVVFHHRVSPVTSLDRVFDASLAAETCLEFPILANLIQDSIRQAKAETSLVLRARSQAWLRYWRSLAWWQGPRCNGPSTPLGRFLNRSSPGRTGSNFHRGEQR